MKIIGLENMGNLEFKTELQKGGKFVTYPYVISVLVITFRRTSNVYFIRADESAVVKGLPFALLSFLLGWWGIPWGIIYTIGAIWTNLNGGRDVTKEILSSMGQAASPQNMNPA
jgi:hypothetical protein